MRGAKASYDKALWLLQRAKELAAYPVLTKSGIIVGLGETNDEVVDTLRDLRAHGVDVVTIGQYLQPSAKHAKIDRWVHPDEFRWFREQGEALGFGSVFSGPLVRSSYRADEQRHAAERTRRNPLLEERGRLLGGPSRFPTQTDLIVIVVVVIVVVPTTFIDRARRDVEQGIRRACVLLPVRILVILVHVGPRVGLLASRVAACLRPRRTAVPGIGPHRPDVPVLVDLHVLVVAAEDPRPEAVVQVVRSVGDTEVPEWERVLRWIEIVVRRIYRTRWLRDDRCVRWTH